MAQEPAESPPPHAAAKHPSSERVIYLRPQALVVPHRCRPFPPAPPARKRSTSPHFVRPTPTDRHRSHRSIDKHGIVNPPHWRSSNNLRPQTVRFLHSSTTLRSRLRIRRFDKPIQHQLRVLLYRVQIGSGIPRAPPRRRWAWRCGRGGPLVVRRGRSRFGFPARTVRVAACRRKLRYRQLPLDRWKRLCIESGACPR